MLRSRILLLSLAAMLWHAGGTLAPAQEVRASIGGRVMDAQAALVPGAAVTVVSDETAVEQRTRTNAQGNWLVEFLLPGHYHFTVAAPGFKNAERTGIELQAADSKQIDVRLEVGSASQSIVVTAEAPLVDNTSAVSGTVVTSDEILEMPSASHVVTLLAMLSPGVIPMDQDNNVVQAWSNLGASQFTANGGRNNTWSNSFQLDGMPNTKSGGNVSFIPPMDSVQEFRVQLNAYDASIGRQAGATINMQTRAGGKDYHGTLYEFNQNNLLNANLFQYNRIGESILPVHLNKFGATIGGPVWIPRLYRGGKRTFFFISYDETLNLNPAGSGTISIPAALERKGDFSQSWTTQNVAGQLVRYPVVVYDPLSSDASGNRTPFPGSIIPETQLNPIARNIISYMPLPNTPPGPTSSIANNYAPPNERQDKFPVVSVRVDQNWNNNHHSFATVRWNHLWETQGDTFGLTNILAGNHHERVAENIGLDHVWTIGNNKVLDLRYTLNRFEEPQADMGSGFDPTRLGFPASFAADLEKPSFPRITGFAGDFGTGQAGNYTNNTHHIWAANLTQVRSNHTLHYGAEFWVLQEARGGVGNQGQFDFNANWTRRNNNNNNGPGDGSNFASFLLGLPSGGNLPRNANALYSQHFTAFFIQDDWRVSGRLTLNFGLRWDYERPVMERFNRLTDRYDPAVTNPITPAARAAYAAILANPANANNTGVQVLAQLRPADQFTVPGAQLFAGVNGVPRSAVNPDYHEWGPRAGFAYRLAANTVLRGGFGRFVQADFVTGGQNGFSRSTNLTATQDNFRTPYETLADPFRNGILAPTGSSLGPLTNLGQGVNWDNPDLGRMYSWEYSLHIQRQVRNWLFEAGYSHNKTYNIPWGWNRNLPSFALWQQLRTPAFSAAGKPPGTLPWDLQVPNPFYQLPGVSPSAGIYTSKTIALNQLLNPSPILGGINQNNPTGSNQYDAGLGKIERRFSRGFSVIGAFTWAKLFEDTSFIGPQIAGPTIEHKLGGENRPLRLSVAPIWTVPVGRGMHFGHSMSRILDAFAGGWEMTGNFAIQSGVPVIFGTDSFFSGKNFALPRDKQSLNQWFDTSQFFPFPNANTLLSTLASYPAWTGVQNLPGYGYVPTATDTIKNGVYQDFATYIRNYPSRWGMVRASRLNNADIGCYKVFRPTERARLQLRFNAFNLFNHPRFPGPDTNPNDSGFGTVNPSQNNQARMVELGARLTF
jgi:hypothetical protein